MMTWWLASMRQVAAWPINTANRNPFYMLPDGSVVDFIAARNAFRLNVCNANGATIIRCGTTYFDAAVCS